MWPFRSRPEPYRPEPGPATSRSYGKWAGRVQMLGLAAIVAVAGATVPAVAQPAGGGRPVKIVALGDSLTAGFGLPADAAFPVRLERALTGKGLAVTIANAGVSGETSADGLARLDWSVPNGTDAVIVELGANDVLRGIDPKRTRATLETILRRFAERRIPVLLVGMRAPPNMGADYARAFDAIYPDLAATYDVVFYPFFLDGVAAERGLNQGDGIHPTAAGVDVIVARLLPKAEELVARARTARAP
jgi:acyl-CoA thioesterase-1